MSVHAEPLDAELTSCSAKCRLGDRCGLCAKLGADVHGGHFKHGASITTLLVDDKFRDLLFILRLLTTTAPWIMRARKGRQREPAHAVVQTAGNGMTDLLSVGGRNIRKLSDIGWP